MRSILSTLLSTFLLLTAVQGTAAQAPESADVQAQAAAMALTSEDLPTGFILTGETFLPLPDASAVPGVTAHYVSVYTNVDSGQQIRSYIYLFNSEDEAAAGFEALEGDEPETVTDSEVEVGSGAAELSTGTYEAADGQTIGTTDVTFVDGSVVAGVAVDNPDGSEPEEQLVTDLANIAATRVGEVQAGNTPAGLDLPAQVIPLAEGGVMVQAGYLSPAESEAIYDAQGSALSGLQSSWVQTVAFGEEGVAPRVTIGVTVFGSPEEAAEVVEQADRIFQPLADQEKVEDVEASGADSVVAYRYTSRDGDVAAQESYRIIFSQGDSVTVVDVQGAPDTETAEAAANTISASQATCQAEGTCERPSAPGVIPGE